jgi:signal transduction histidine kinase
MQKINREGYLKCFIAPPNSTGSGLGMYIVKETLEKLGNNYFEIERK